MNQRQQIIGVIASSLSGDGGFDADAQAFIDAVGTLDATNQNAINALVVDLKGFSIWTKLLVINPKAGSTATEHKWNLKDPRNLDAAYRYTYTGSWTHSANGAEADGTSAFAESHLNPNTVGMTGDICMGAYVNTQRTLINDRHLIGAFSSSNNFISIQFNALNQVVFNGYASAATSVQPEETPQPGFYGISILTSTKGYHKSDSPSGATNGTDVPNETIYEGALNLSGSFYQGVDCRIACSFIGNGLNDAEMANLQTAIITFETALSRNV